MHSIPENGGFPQNQDYIDALNLDLHLSPAQKELKKLIKKYEESLKQLEAITQDPEAYIEAYFSNIASRVELQREKLKLRVNLMSDEMLEKLRSFENNLIQNQSDHDHEQN